MPDQPRPDDCQPGDPKRPDAEQDEQTTRLTDVTDVTDVTDLPELLAGGLAAGFGPRTEIGDGERPSVLARLDRTGNANKRITLRPIVRSDSSRPTPSAERPSDFPRDLGKYRIQGELARGGVGVVLQGYDADLGREVAFKVLHERYGSDPELMERFIEEAQIGGQLQHPGIVPVYDLGIGEGRPYFTMKLIDGQTLAAMLSKRVDLADDRRKFLGIFETICQTIAYAHARGVIHRDLKPANVMVGAFGEMQVVDWGLAKVLAEGGATVDSRHSGRAGGAPKIETVRSQSDSDPTHSGMGTPAYMPPEQVWGEEMGEPSDVFSLGSVLCEILTGSPAYAGRSEEAMALAKRCATEDALRRLAACDADPDLLELCEDCLHADAKDRPRGAQELAGRMNAYLHSVEERAQQSRIDAAEQRVKTQSAQRARRLTIGLAASVVATLSIGIGGYLTVDANAQERRRGVEAKVLEAMHEARLEEGRGHWSATLAANRRARDLLTEDVGAELADRVAVEFERVESAANEAARVAGLRTRHETLLRGLERVRQPEFEMSAYPVDWAVVADTYRATFANDEVDLLVGDEAAACERLAERPSRILTTAHIDAWAQSAFKAGRTSDFHRLQRIAEFHDVDPTRSKLRAAVRDGRLDELKRIATTADLERWDPVTLELLAGSLRRLGAHRSALAVYRRGQAAHSSDFLLTFGLGRVLGNQLPPRYVESARFLQGACALRPHNLEVQHLLGNALTETGDLDAAQKIFVAAAKRWSSDGHIWFHLGALENERHDLEAARVAYEKAVRLAPRFAKSHANLGILLRKMGRYVESEVSLREAIRQQPDDYDFHRQLAYTLVRGKREMDVIRDYGVAVAEKPGVATLHLCLGLGLQTANRHALAVDSYRTAIRLRPELPGAHHLLAACLMKLRKFTEAGIVMEAGRRLQPENVDVLRVSARVHTALGQTKAALRTIERAIERRPGNGMIHGEFAEAHAAAGDHAAAVDEFVAATRLRTGSPNMFVKFSRSLVALDRKADGVELMREQIEEQPDNVVAHHGLAHFLTDAGEFRAALSAIAEARRLCPDDSGVILTESRIHVTAGQLGKGAAALEALVRLRPEDWTAHVRLADARGRAREWKAAIDSYSRAVELGLIDPVIHMNLGACAMRLNRDGDAIAALRNAISLGGGGAQAHHFLGKLLFKRGERESAIKAGRAAVRLQPRLFDYRSQLGTYLHAAGRSTEAIASYREAVRLMPKLALAHYYLGGIRVLVGEHESGIADLRRAIQIDPDLVQRLVKFAKTLDAGTNQRGARLVAKLALETREDPEMQKIADGVGRSPRPGRSPRSDRSP